MSCLVEHRGNITDYQCNQYITKMTTIIFSDFRLICGFLGKCHDDINALHCGSISTREKVPDQHTHELPAFLLTSTCLSHCEGQPSPAPPTLPPTTLCYTQNTCRIFAFAANSPHTLIVGVQQPTEVVCQFRHWFCL